MNIVECQKNIAEEVFNHVKTNSEIEITLKNVKSFIESSPAIGHLIQNYADDLFTEFFREIA